MEVTAVNLHYIGAHICQSLNELGFILWLASFLGITCFLVQSAAPGVHSTILRESHGVIVTARNSFGAHW